MAQLTSSTLVTLDVTAPLRGEVDLSLLGLSAARRLEDDRYFVFYNQPHSPEGAIRMHPGSNGVGQRFEVDLERLPDKIGVLTVLATSDTETFRALSRGVLRLLVNGQEKARFEFTGDQFDQERAVMVFDLYRHSGEWRMAAVAQGFNGGLRAFLESVGAEVEDDPTPPPVPSQDPNVTTWAHLSSAPRRAGAPGHCPRCGRPPAQFGRLDPATGRCKDCARAVQQALAQFRQVFLEVCADGIMTPGEWRSLQAFVTREQLDADEALAYVRSDAVRFIERTVILARADGELSAQEEEDFDRLRQLLKVPDHLIATPIAEIAELKEATRIRQGHLPRQSTRRLLDPDELCHLETPARFRQITARGLRTIHGHLIVTSKQVHFSNDEGGWSVKYKNVLQVEEVSGGVNLELSVKRGNGVYLVDRPLLVGATLDAVVRMHKRLLVAPQTERTTRHIPQAVRIQVWQRDGGKCVQCGDTRYLEFDHIIPHSRGGANTLGNVQLLCRDCNLKKGDRI